MAEPTEADREKARAVIMATFTALGWDFPEDTVIRTPALNLIASALAAERETALIEAAQVADAVHIEWRSHAANIARADDLVGGLAQSTYTRYAEIAEQIAIDIRALAAKEEKR